MNIKKFLIGASASVVMLGAIYKPYKPPSICTRLTPFLFDDNLRLCLQTEK